MSGALFLLTVNFLIAQLFCVFFLVISKRSRIPEAGRCFALSFAVASLSAVCELVIRFTDFDRLASFGAFSSVLVALFMIRLGIGRLYAVPVKVVPAGWFFAVSLAINLIIFDLPRSTLAHALGYQLPFFVAAIISALTIYRSGRREKADLFLMGLLVATALQFLLKVYFIVTFGAGADAQSYLASAYALISQSLSAVLVVSIGLTLLAVLVVEIMDDAKARSETDPLSALYNRRGFNERVGRILARPGSGYPHCLVVCDIDHFKVVNDTYGHQAGDQVIAAFGAMLIKRAPPEAICGRLGGEEFAIFLPSGDEATGYLFAQGLRSEFSILSVPGIPLNQQLTASFGVCDLADRNDLIEDVMRRADAALYSAKKSGRNRVNRASVVDPAWMEKQARA
ncbi:GGDEF domain-containing protein [Rhizobium sp. 32-5/1]|uniref:GGDEF domain-containing protein n=1 Tax=Rhizobium sp. 32-5/1 TaxID=3019602 RepID=UPI00240E95A8|nr:GGDEF domain-containing protein [Rhizobium sp. 32-5/1]WEZ83377.1 GGDEF domain-containing protein [Rhizobium sp. 32-5/1]